MGINSEDEEGSEERSYGVTEVENNMTVSREDIYILSMNNFVCMFLYMSVCLCVLCLFICLSATL